MQNLLCTVCACYLLGAQSMYSRSSKAAPPLTSFRRTTSNMTSKFLSFLRGISARFHLLPWCPVWFHTSFKLFSICGEEQRWTKRGSCGSISHTMVLQSHFKELQHSLLSEFFFQALSLMSRVKNFLVKTCWIRYVDRVLLLRKREWHLREVIKLSLALA